MSLTPWLDALHLELLDLRRQNTLSHAMLFVAGEGVGQDLLAQNVAADLMCEISTPACQQCHACDLFKAHSHPDYYLVDGKDTTIKVDQVRHLIKQVSQKSQVGKTKVVCVLHAQNMNINASNALLKILEEPPQGTFFILTAAQSANLLPTIKSRCLTVKIPTPSPQQVAQWLEQEFPNQSLEELFWLTTEPFLLSELVRSGKEDFYRQFPVSIQACLSSSTSLDLFVRGIDNQNATDYVDALLAICHQCICYSTGQLMSAQQHTLYIGLLEKLGVHGIFERHQALQKLKQQMQMTHLNPTIQLKSELNRWFF